MSMSDTALCAIRELYRGHESIHDSSERCETAIRHAIYNLERYCVLAMDAPDYSSTPVQIERAVAVLDDYIVRTLDGWSDCLPARLDDFNVIAHGLKTGTLVELEERES